MDCGTMSGRRAAMILAALVGVLVLGTACSHNHDATTLVSLPGGPDCSGAVSLQVGTLPVLISSPHGADRSHKIAGIADRRGFGVPQFVAIADQFTDEIAAALATELERRTGEKPYTVIAELHRSEIDFNRPANGSFEDDRLQPCYTAYHSAMRQFTDNIRQRWQRGLLLDVHGQSKRPGVLIRGTRNGQTVTAIRQIYGENSYLGADSLFGFMAAHGYTVLPESGQAETLYRGGYIVHTYGSHRADGIDALQIEIGRHLRDTPAKRRQLVDHLAQALVQQLSLLELLTEVNP